MCMPFYQTDNPKSFKQNIDNTLVALQDHEGSEVMIINRTGNDVLIFDNENFDPDNHLLIRDGESLTLRGINNSNMVSAQCAAGVGDIYYRVNYFSNTGH